MSELQTVFKKVDYIVDGLLHYIDIGDIGLPDIQRPFVWSAAKVRDLFDSMFRGFPVGYLLFWANGGVDGTRHIGVGDKAHLIPALLIVDGQQRLTSLYAVLRGRPVLDRDYHEKHIEIAFRPRDGVFEVADAAIRRDPEFIPNISAIWASGKSSWSLVNGFIEGLQARHSLTSEEKEIVSRNIDKLYDLQKYPFTALEIASTVDEEQVADIFVRINSEGVKLNQADFILTLMSVFWDQGRADLERFCRNARRPSLSMASPFNYLIQPDPDQLLRVSVGLGFRRARLQHAYSILRGKDLETGEFSEERRIRQFTILQGAQQHVLDLNNWHEFLRILMRAGYRRAGMITSQIAALYSYTLFLIGKRDFRVDNHALRNTIARWFFMTVLTGRYTDSPESTMEQDLARLRDVKDANGFTAMLDALIADAFTEDFWNVTLPNQLLATASARSPALFAYYASLNLLGAIVLFSKMKVSELLDPASKPPKSAIERHHLFPRGYLAKLGVTEIRDINQIANYALIEWADNADISDKAPADYFSQYFHRTISTSEAEQMCYWHALPEGWENMEYHQFLDVRRKAMARVIRDGFARLYE